MTQLWAVLGLLCIDHGFRDDLFGTPATQKDVQNKVQEYHFILSRYEVGEVVRWISKPGLKDILRDKIHPLVWDDMTDCDTGLTFAPGYKHGHYKPYA